MTFISPPHPRLCNRAISQRERSVPTMRRASELALLVTILALGCTGNRESGVRPERPQEPASPLPYRAEEVRFRNARAGIELAGTLTLPVAGGPHPAVVLVSGSGPQDRDETVAGHKPFLVLADHLTRHGIAVLRFDDRGVGASTGDFATATIRDFVGDARAAIEFLQSRKDIDAGRLGLAGHSEGGLVVPLVALEMPGQIACLVLMATPGLPGEQIFYLQDAAEARARGTDEGAIARSRQRKEQMFSVLKEEPDIRIAAERLRRIMKAMKLTEEEEAGLAAGGMSLDNLINQQIRLLNNAATRFFLVYDPIPTLSRVAVPVLAITGERDLQVPPAENLPHIRAALESGACPHHLVHELAGLNHLFQTSHTGLPSDYAQIQETIAPVALQMISDWVLKVMRGSPSEFP
jgi:uncharacterized protein